MPTDAFNKVMITKYVDDVNIASRGKIIFTGRGFCSHYISAADDSRPQNSPVTSLMTAAKKLHLHKHGQVTSKKHTCVLIQAPGKTLPEELA